MMVVVGLGVDVAPDVREVTESRQVLGPAHVAARKYLVELVAAFERDAFDKLQQVQHRSCTVCQHVEHRGPACRFQPEFGMEVRVVVGEQAVGGIHRVARTPGRSPKPD